MDGAQCVFLCIPRASLGKLPTGNQDTTNEEPNSRKIIENLQVAFFKLPCGCARITSTNFIGLNKCVVGDDGGHVFAVNLEKMWTSTDAAEKSSESCPYFFNAKARTFR